ncbi:hypothetical protein Mapa_003849 [Marchantia paleacea]|nr:hypothetical protein Mapa_003849 [Marchantia paleacea]
MQKVGVAWVRSINGEARCYALFLSSATVCVRIGTGMAWDQFQRKPHSLPPLAHNTFRSVGIFASTPHVSAICHIRMCTVSRAGRPLAVKHESRGIMTGAQSNNSFDHHHACLSPFLSVPPSQDYAANLADVTITSP